LRHIELNNMLMQRGPDGFYQLDKDREALEAFLEEVDGKSMRFGSIAEKIRYLIEHDYYENILDTYTMEQAEEIYALAESCRFAFPS